MLHSLFPSFAEFSNELITPPFIIVGSNLALPKIDAIKDVVVVLPCEPETTMFFLMRLYVLTYLLFINR